MGEKVGKLGGPFLGNLGKLICSCLPDLLHKRTSMTSIYWRIALAINTWIAQSLDPYLLEILLQVSSHPCFIASRVTKLKFLFWLCFVDLDGNFGDCNEMYLFGTWKHKKELWKTVLPFWKVKFFPALLLILYYCFMTFLESGSGGLG